MTEKQMFDRLKQLTNYTDKGVAGLMGNLRAESGLSSTNLQNTFNTRLKMTDEQYTSAVDSGVYKNFIKDGAGYGLAQWTYSTRKQNLFNAAKRKKVSIGDCDTQLEFLAEELKGYKEVHSVLSRTDSIKEASDIVLVQFEKPKVQSDSVKELRASYGTAIYNRCCAMDKAQSSTESLFAKAVIDIALNEVGYLEKSKSAYQKDKSVLDRKTDGAGSDNYTKYGRDMHSIYPKAMDFPAPWCDSFNDWCFYKAYGIANAKKLIKGEFDDYTVNSCRMYQKAGALDTVPTVGSQVFFTKNGKPDGCYHTGLVYAVDGSRFYTVEGNTSSASKVVANGGSVEKKSYSISAYRGKTLFGHPKYDSVSMSDGSSYNVRITASTLRIREKPTTASKTLGYVKKNESFSITNEQGGFGKLSSGAGWISLKYVVKV